eukprot:TRINITY_DN3842_c1_g1_i1.p1 TRINITY_DN3842_c1_g1~~TRINITY_DN3842_c1_g1_i1.p1  ORF type:complete len:661 (+),score=257.24 TRINITY_DN3842_c1_g1_i1:55-1983(+)
MERVNEKDPLLKDPSNDRPLTPNSRSRIVSMPGMARHLQGVISAEYMPVDTRPVSSQELNQGSAERKTNFLQGRRTAFWSSVLNLTNAIIGSGILTLPYIAANSGLALFMILLVCGALLMDYTLQLLLAAAHVTAQPGRRYSYELLGEQAFGSWGRLAVSLCIFLQNIGNMTSYMRVTADIVPDAIQNLADVHDNDFLSNEKYVTAVLILIFVFPMCCSSRMGPLAYVGLAQCVIIIGFVVYMVAEAAHFGGDMRQPPNEPLEPFAPTMKTFLAMPTFCFSYMTHTSVMPIYEELQEADAIGRTMRKKKRMTQAVHTAIFMATALYATAVVSGYSLFGSNIKANILQSFADPFSADSGRKNPFTPGSYGATLLFVLSVLLSIPLQCFPFRKALNSLVSIARNDYEPTTALASDIFSIDGYKTLKAEERADRLGLSIASCEGSPETAKFMEHILMNPNGFKYTVPPAVDADLLGMSMDRYVRWIRYGDLMLSAPTKKTFEPQEGPQSTCPRPDSGWLIHVAQTLGGVVVSLILALYVPSIATVFSVTGATASLSLQLLLPPAIFIKLSLRKSNLSDVRKYGSILEAGVAEKDLDDNASMHTIETRVLNDDVNKLAYALPTALFVFGICVFIVSWVGMILQWVG